MKIDMPWYDMAHALPVKGHVAALRFLLDEKLPSEPDVSGRTLMHEARLTLNWWIDCFEGYCRILLMFFGLLWMFELPGKEKS